MPIFYNTYISGVGVLEERDAAYPNIKEASVEPGLNAAKEASEGQKAPSAPNFLGTLFLVPMYSNTFTGRAYPESIGLQSSNQSQLVVYV